MYNQYNMIVLKEAYKRDDLETVKKYEEKGIRLVYKLSDLPCPYNIEAAIVLAIEECALTRAAKFYSVNIMKYILTTFEVDKPAIQAAMAVASYHNNGDAITCILDNLSPDMMDDDIKELGDALLSIFTANRKCEDYIVARGEH